ncbi:hypothetical protein K458DRAFT_199878 [Lentithecium fluviatile CBS 122367]|uniref:Uncharacterized protein n=1 Tax=Lentithecium fluviatile CBS 122367 TaxID=1168545 RepID=A0A6G1J8T7_9PLEO|nr:hypothetical protein K458DRAFT_199878 [Lentithecium fluviatile CBS 122367]
MQAQHPSRHCALPDATASTHLYPRNARPRRTVGVLPRCQRGRSSTAGSRWSRRRGQLLQLGRGIAGPKLRWGGCSRLRCGAGSGCGRRGRGRRRRGSGGGGRALRFR